MNKKPDDPRLKMEPLLLFVEKSQLRWLGRGLRMPEDRLPLKILRAIEVLVEKRHHISLKLLNKIIEFKVFC